jgi:hypothetical protein
VANELEQATSGRASCRTCKQTIAKGELRLGVETPSQFGSPSMHWHHAMCAAGKLPAELKAALDTYTGVVANRAELDHAMTEAIAKGTAKPAGFPYADRAPTGRAKCMQCEQPIAKDAFRIAVEREIETGSMVSRGAGYLHPGCVAASVANVPGAIDDLVTALRANSRLPAAALDSVIAAVATIA